MNRDVKIRLGLLIRNGSIHLPDANSQARKKPTTMALRMSVTVTVREKIDFAVAVVSIDWVISERCSPT